MLERFMDLAPLAQIGQQAAGGASQGAGSAAKPGGMGGQTMTMIMMAGMVLIFYFMIIMPQSKQQKARKAMLESLKVGDKVLTSSGIYGIITKMGKGDGSLRVRVAQGVEFRMARSAIASKTTKDEKDEEE